MLPLTVAREVYNNTLHDCLLLEYRKFLLSQIKSLLKLDNNTQTEALSYLPECVKNYIISKSKQFLTQENNSNPDSQAIKFFNSFFKSKKDKPYALMFIKHLYNLYLDSQKKSRTPKSCVFYINNTKIVFIKKEDPFHNFKSDKITQIHCPNKNTILFHTIGSCKGKRTTRLEHSKSNIETKVKIFNFANFIAFLFVFDIKKERTYHKYGKTNNNINYIATELYLIDKSSSEIFFSHNIFHDYTKKPQILESDLTHIFTLITSKNLTVVSSDKEEFILKPSINKWTVLEKINKENCETLIITL